MVLQSHEWNPVQDSIDASWSEIGSYFTWIMGFTFSFEFLVGAHRCAVLHDIMDCGYPSLEALYYGISDAAL